MRISPVLMMCSLLALLPSCRVGQEGLFDPCAPETTTETDLVVGQSLLESIPAQNVLMISIDTLRRDRVGRYNCERLSPYIDTLLESGLVLDNHHSCSSWTLPSATCVLTGQSPIDLGAFPTINSKQEIPQIDQTTPTLAGELARAGLSTLLVSANLYISSKSGLNLGYDKVITKRKPANILLNTVLSELEVFETEDANKPWFAHVHLIDPHTPYSPPGDYLSKIEELPAIPWDLNTAEGTREMNESWSDLSSKERDDVGQHLVYRYGAEIRYMNDEIEAFFGEMETRGWLEDTLVVVWSDHGEQFWEHGDWGHGISLHTGENAAIAAFIGPGITPMAWNHPTTHVDIAPTILGALGLSAPEAWTGDQVGLADSSRPFFAATAPKSAEVQQSVRYKDHLLLYRWDGEKALYNVAEDPFETNNIYNSNSEPTQELWEHLEPEVQRLKALFPDKSEPVAIGP